MKRCLADVNVLLALLVRGHDDHARASKWFESLRAGEACLCRMVQLALIRLLGNKTIMSDHAIPASAAWRLIDELLEDERIDLVGEPKLLDSEFPTLLNYPVPTVKLVGDAYLAAFAIAASYRLVTFDKGFRQFRALECEIPAP